MVFVSSDRSQESFDQYFGTMPWLAVPYAEEQRRKELAELMGVQGKTTPSFIGSFIDYIFLMSLPLSGIPTLVIVNENNEILTRDGRCEVVEDPEGDVSI